MMNVYLVNNMIKLKDTTGHDWTKAYYLEAVFNHVFNEQYEYGCKVDLDLMQQLEIDITDLIESLEVQIYESIPSKLLWKVTAGTSVKMNTANGAYSKRFLSFAEKAELSLDQVAGDVTPVEFEMLNLESPKQRNECLLKMGWVPLEFNYKETVDGRPLYDETGNKVILSAKLTEESVTCLPTGQLMLRYLVYSHKLKLVKGLKKLVRPDGTIGAGGISCGTNTARAVHRGVVNIPRVGDDFGTELRSLFIAREGKVILGADLSALENRLAGHFTWDFDNGEYAYRLMEEDPHNNTVNLFSGIGLPIDRNTAKTVNYALGYGARPEKLQSVLKCTIPLAKQAFDLWWADRQVMLKLQEQLLSALDGRGQLVSKFRLAEGAYILGIDGRKLFVRSTHSLVNSLIQNAGSLINKFITSYIYAQIEKRSLDAHFILNFHDEVGIELRLEDVPAMKALIVEATDICNKYYNLKVPMSMDSRVGVSWAEVH